MKLFLEKRGTFLRVILMLAVLFLIAAGAPGAVFSQGEADPGYQEFTGKNFVPVNKQWTVVFNYPVDLETLEGNVQVKDGEGNPVPGVTAAAGDTPSSIAVLPPEGGYPAGESFTLYLGQGLLSLEGERLGQGTTMPFSTAAGDLPVVGSRENLVKIFRSYYYWWAEDEVSDDEGAPLDMDMGEQAYYSTYREFAETNIQVKGVDEADILKTDGQYLYQVRGSQVTISRAYPVEDMEVIKTIDLEDKNMYPQELYVDQDNLVILGNLYLDYHYDDGYYWEVIDENYYSGDREPAAIDSGWWPPYYYRSAVTAVIYDIQDKDNIRWLKDVELDGHYLSSRKIDSVVYLLANQYVDHHHLEMGIESRPSYRDSSVGEGLIYLDYDEISYFPDQHPSNYLLIAALDLEEPEKETTVEAYLGAGHNIYMSRDNLYVAITDWNNTSIYKFAVEGTDISFAGTGEVPGSILNQFSMDEYQGHFRIATTGWEEEEGWEQDGETWDWWGWGQSTNNVFILDEGLEIVGQLTGIAPGESIFAARFMGERAYLVTFETIDPFFVLDLADPEDPKVLGELKIPGFSNYLHPLEDNFILGIGRNTALAQRKDREGNPVGSPVVFETGIKMSIFDVRDVSNPREKHVEIIGGTGTFSEVLYNHRALLLDLDRGIMAFPITIWEGSSQPFDYGQFQFQGACVYLVDLEDGFLLRGKVTHLSQEDLEGRDEYPQWYWHNWESEVNRALYIGDILYTTSQNFIKAHDIHSLEHLNTLELEGK